MNIPRTPGVLAIGRDRLYYSGLLGNSRKPRCLGAYALYFASDKAFEIDRGDGWQTLCAAVVEPFRNHRLHAPSGHIHMVGLEPESLSVSAATGLSRLDGTALARIGAGIVTLRHQFPDVQSKQGFSNAAFDRLVFGQPFAPSQMDPRITRAVGVMCDELTDSTASAEDYAHMVGLSPSRFLHLFKLNTGVSFRALRMWKRARRFLDYANGSHSLTDVALDLGYPDSSHFSHSIRRIFGLKPRSIRQGSRHLQVFTGADYRLAPEALAS